VKLFPEMKTSDPVGSLEFEDPRKISWPTRVKQLSDLKRAEALNPNRDLVKHEVINFDLVN